MNFAQEIKEAVSTRALCEMVGLKLDRHGNALCPFHGDTNKSLKVYKDASRGWACFGCHRGGTVIDFAMLWYGISYKQAVVRLDSDFALGLPISRKRTPEERKELRREKQEQAERKRAAENAFFAAKTSEENAHNMLCTVLSVIEENRPKRPCNAFSDLWAEAVKILPEVRDEYERALDALNEARKEVERLGSAAKTGTANRRLDTRRLPECGAV